MCFSAVASFVAAGVTGGIGVVSLARVKEPRELPLAAAPIIFALQQSTEGLLWLNLPLAPNGSTAINLTLLFQFFAEVLWPVYAPIAVLLIEPVKNRRRYMLLCLCVGLGVAAYLFWGIVSQRQAASIQDGHIVYVKHYKDSYVLALAYLAATCLPLILSSQRTIITLGVTILAGSVIAYFLYWRAFVSVWCFFAAAASAVILFHCEAVRSQRLRMAVT
jgi:hypothetical protein